MSIYQAAIGSSSIEERFKDPSISKSSAIETVLEILERKESQRDNVLDEAEYEIVSMCLDSIGSQEVSLASDGSLQGHSDIVYTAETPTAAIEITADFQVHNVWDRTRREWACTMALQKKRGSVPVSHMDFSFTFASFGRSEEGLPIVLFNFSYERSIDTPSQLQAFNKGGQLKVSEYDITSNVQWGYLVVSHCKIFFEDGTVLTA